MYRFRSRREYSISAAECAGIIKSKDAMISELQSELKTLKTAHAPCDAQACQLFV